MQITKYYYVRHFRIGDYVFRYIYATRQVLIIYQVQILFYFLLSYWDMNLRQWENVELCYVRSHSII